MARTRVKICGITRIDDAVSAAQSGADAIGLVFCPSSPRAIDIKTAQHIIAEIPPFITTVALFMDNSALEVQRVLDEIDISLLQFHGRETAVFCEQFNRPYLKALPMLEAINIQEYAQQFQSAKGYLLDAIKFGQAGGRGEIFSWQNIPQNLAKPLVLAGGLSAANVVEAIKATQCYGVDVSSGVEQSKGIKDDNKIREFIEQVKIADNENG